MSDVSSLALSLPGGRESSPSSSREPHALDLTATYRFSYLRERWLSGAGKTVQSVLMIGTGGFLLTQVSATPNLAVQIAIVGTMLIVGGLILLSRVPNDFFGGITIDRQGLKASRAWSRITCDWSEVGRWQINETAANIAELPSVEIWTGNAALPQGIPGGHLPEKDYLLLRQLFEAFAEGKESA